MDHINALGVTIISSFQNGLLNHGDFFHFVNIISDPRHLLSLWFPLVSVVDSVFASQLLLCMSFGGWFISIMKWWVLEDRPYWWVRDTLYYSLDQRPHLSQTSQTCETGPGSPSEHMSASAMAILLVFIWLASIMNDRNVHYKWWKYAVYPVFTFTMVCVMMARMYAATNFPHQCLLGTFIGSLLAPMLCLFISDPYIFQYGVVAKYDLHVMRFYYILAALLSAVITALTYMGLKMGGWEPAWSIKLAYRYCEDPENIHRSSMPLTTLMYSSSSLLGWALFVSPALTKYRYNTKKRSLVIALLVTVAFILFDRFVDIVSGELDIKMYYLIQIVVTIVRPAFFLHVLPYVAKLPDPCTFGWLRFFSRKQIASDTATVAAAARIDSSRLAPVATIYAATRREPNERPRIVVYPIQPCRG